MVVFTTIGQIQIIRNTIYMSVKVLGLFIVCHSRELNIKNDFGSENFSVVHIKNKMGDFEITVVNKTGDDGTPGRHVNVMLFQTLPDPLTTRSYSTAWKVEDVQYPGSLGPILLPEKVEFYVIDHASKNPRTSGPFKVNFGDIAEVTQTDAASAPSVKVVGSGQPKGGIKVKNKGGNKQSLEMALFKNGSKIVSIKNVRPADSVYLAIKPVIYVADIEGIVEGEDFEATTQATTSTQIELFPENLHVKIQITQKDSGELVFSKA
jgi:hypothetical protein